MNIRNSLEEISETDTSPLRQVVAKHALETYETENDTKQFFKELSEHGCVSGIVNSLIS